MAETRKDFIFKVVIYKTSTRHPGAMLVPTHTLPSPLEGNSSVIFEKSVLKLQILV